MSAKFITWWTSNATHAWNTRCTLRNHQEHDRRKDGFASIYLHVHPWVRRNLASRADRVDLVDHFRLVGQVDLCADMCDHFKASIAF
jgi:hypothetical protein